MAAFVLPVALQHSLDQFERYYMLKGTHPTRTCLSAGEPRSAQNLNRPSPSPAKICGPRSASGSAMRLGGETAAELLASGSTSGALLTRPMPMPMPTKLGPSPSRQVALRWRSIRIKSGAPFLRRW